MSKKTIAKFFAFVIQAVAVSCLLPACAFVASDPGPAPLIVEYGLPEVVGQIKTPEVIESSGIAASRCQRDVFWTHNDSGDGPFLYAFNARGDNLGTWRVPDAENKDWEDIGTWKDSRGKCFIYVGEIGDNKLIWPVHTVYRVAEPLIIAAGPATTRENALLTDRSESLNYVYPDGDKNAETLMVHPRSGDIYILTKNESGPSGVYRVTGVFSDPKDQTAVKIAGISVPAVPNGLLTGGDVSPDGRRVIVCDYLQAYELSLPDGTVDFDEIWTQEPRSIDVGKRKTGEAVGYNIDGSEIYATSEGRNPPIIRVRRLN